MSKRGLASFSTVPLLMAVLLAHPACDGCGGAPPATDAGETAVGVCEGDADCAGGVCVGGECLAAGGEDGGPGGQPGADAGPEAQGELSVQPGLDVEFGAQLIGYPVTQDIILINTGDASLKIFAVLLDQDGDEFTAEPEGNLGVDVGAGDNIVVQVTHTPADGTPDFGELKVLHDGVGGIVTINLSADFKGDAELSSTLAIDTLEPSVEIVGFGENEPGVPATQTLWLRNTGRQDSVLTISDLTLTPTTVGFSIASEPDLPIALSAWSNALCPDGTTTACPPDAAACDDLVCVDDVGDPLHALPLTVEYLAGLAPVTATLSIEHDTDGAVQETDITLTGSPTQPDILVEPAMVDFGVSLVDAPVPAEVVVTVSNVGPGPLLIERVVEPDEPAFELDYSRPVPMIDGDPALRLDNGATPLEITVTFAPPTNEAYTAFLVLHTNDGDELQVNIPLEGVGLICQDNAHVDGSSGVCVCDEGYLTCGAECRLPGATACGDSCTDCTAVPGLSLGTQAACGTGGACEYSCTGGYYDLDDGSDGTPGDNDWNGCEYRCEVDPAFQSEFTCDGRDEDCNGVIDDGLDPDLEDRNGANNTRPTAALVSPIDEVPATPNAGATETLSQRSLYPAGDQDWFRVRAVEGDGSLSCAEEIPCLEGGQENYRTVFEVVSPNGLDYDIQVWAPTYPNYDDPNGTGTTFSDSNNDDTIALDWSRSSSLASCVLCNGFGINCFDGGYGCAFPDSQWFWVNIKPAAGQSGSCEPYELKVTSISLPPGS